MNNQKQEETIGKLKLILPCEQFIITGSYALVLYGIIKLSDTNDIDIILVNPEPSTIEMLKKFMEKYPAKTSPNETSSVKYIFMFDDIKIDVFFETKKIITGLVTENYTISSVNDIVQAKKSYNRPKDWMQLRYISRLFWTEKDFQEYMNKQTLPEINGNFTNTY